MRRLEAIRELAAGWKDELVVATTGMISRELYLVRDRPENFYMCGSMGCALPLGLGLALAHPERRVVVLDGDGAALMSLGSLALARHLKLKNLEHIILDNGTYASTGDQPTCSAAADFEHIGFQVRHLRVEPGNEPNTPRLPLDPAEIRERFERAVRGTTPR